MIELRTPCCERSVTAVPLMRSATDVRIRTCPNCRERYQLTITPLGVIDIGAVHEVVWLRVGEKVEADA